MALTRCLQHSEFHARLCQRVAHPQLLDPREPWTDADRYARLRAAEGPPPAVDTPGSRRASALIQPMLQVLRAGPRRVLDIGCDDGSVLDALATHWQVECAVGVDTRAGAIGRASRLHPAHCFYCLDATADAATHLFEDVDTVVLSMVLHHLTAEQRDRLRRRLQQAPRLRWVLVREHDCDAPGWRDFLEVVHGLYALHEDPTFVDHYHADFQSKTQWVGWGATIGRCVRSTSSESRRGADGRFRNPTRSFCALFQTS
jgi:SAM-dependent methyltransferase